MPEDCSPRHRAKRDRRCLAPRQRALGTSALGRCLCRATAHLRRCDGFRPASLSIRTEERFPIGTGRSQRVLSYLRIRKCRSPGRRFRMLEWPSHRLLRSERPCSRAYLTSRRPREKCAPRELPTGPRLSLLLFERSAWFVARRHLLRTEGRMQVRQKISTCLRHRTSARGRRL